MIVKVNDIGDGMFLDIRFREKRLVTDFGSQQKIHTKFLHRFCQPLFNPLTFVLSHFHSDHYSGLYNLSQRNQRINIDKVYFPTLPEFKEKSKLLKAFQTINFYLIGNDSGSMEYDFINLISKINYNKSFKVIPVSQGDHISLGKKSFHVIWPPRKLDDSFTKSVRDAVEDFNVLLKENETLKKIYDSLDNFFYQDKSEEFNYESNPIISEGKLDFIDSNKRKERLKLVSHVNKKLRGVANRISLAYCNNQLLFLGDLEPNEINHSLDYNFSVLKNSYWDLVILPHHGTHWGKKMSEIECKVAISSLGSKLKKNWVLKNKSIAEENYLTHFNGSIVKKLGVSAQMVSCRFFD